MKESQLEDILAEYPHLIEKGLVLVGRQISIRGRRMDLVFKDAFGRQLIVELKAGPIKDEHIGQIMSYEGSMLSHGNPDLRIMLIGTRVPPNIRKSLDHHGIAWKEIAFSVLEAHLKSVGREDLLAGVAEEVPKTKISAPVIPALCREKNDVAGPGKQCLLATMFDSPDEVLAFQDVLARLGKVIYPLRSGVSETSSRWANELLLYVSGTNEIRYKASIISFHQERPTGNEPEFPAYFKPYLDSYKSFMILGSFDAVAPFSWRELLSAEGKPLGSVPQASMFKVLWPSF